MKKRENSLSDLGLRYFILLVIGIIGTPFFYFAFTFLTVNSVYFLLNLFSNPSSLISNTIMLQNVPIEIIGACVAGSAYYLLLILNLSIPNIALKKRLLIILFSFSILLLINVLRIFALSLLYVSQCPLFDITHKLLWYGGSIIFVVGIWFLSVKIFKIKEIPFYSDIKFLSKDLKKIKFSKKH